MHYLPIKYISYIIQYTKHSLSSAIQYVRRRNQDKTYRTVYNKPQCVHYQPFPQINKELQSSTLLYSHVKKCDCDCTKRLNLCGDSQKKTYLCSAFQKQKLIFIKPNNLER